MGLKFWRYQKIMEGQSEGKKNKTWKGKKGVQNLMSSQYDLRLFNHKNSYVGMRLVF